MKDTRYPGVVREQLRNEESVSPPINRIARDRAGFVDFSIVVEDNLCKGYEGGMVS
jgi:hypothetical protein